MEKREILDRTIQFYRESNLEAAYDFITVETKDLNPDSIYDNLRYTLAAMLGKRDLALELLYTAVFEHGFWYKPELLQNDKHLDSIKDSPVFQLTMKECKERFEEEQYVEPYVRVIEKDSDNVFIMLHGNNSSPEDIIHHFDDEIFQSILAFPRATQQIITDVFIWSDFERSVEDIKTVYNDLTTKYSITPKNVTMGAFSAGSTVLLEGLAHGKFSTSKLILIEPWLPRLDDIKTKLKVLKDLGTKVYLIHGDQSEEMVEYALSFKAVLDEYNIPYQHRVMKGMQHQIPDTFNEIYKDILTFFKD